MDILEGNLAKMQTAARHCGKNLRPSLDVLLDVDAGLHRTGVRPDKAPALAERIVSSPHLRLLGIQAYAGQVQHIKAYDERKQASLQCIL